MSEDPSERSEQNKLSEQNVDSELVAPVHLIGIGGAGMSGIARILLARGISVSGSDAKDSQAVASLRAAGARVEIGHDAANLGEARTVVISTAIRATNAELVAAHKNGLTVLRRAQALAALMAGHRGVAVAGTHGKTTTTSMLTVALQRCGADPSFAVGGDLFDTIANAHDGSGALFVVEADESDGSFLAYAPYMSVVTNVEADHLDQHGTVEAYVRAFDDFVARIEDDGELVACLDDPGSAALAERARDAGVRVHTYGTHPDAELRLTDLLSTAGGSSYRAVRQGDPVGDVRLSVPGEHIARNSAAALLAGLLLDQPAAGLLDGLAAYTGVRRRFELKGLESGVRVYDDYAHHPSEIEAQLRTARQVAGAGRLVVAFQPHLYSRTQTFAEQFGAALGLADEVVVMDVHAAREDPVPGVTGASVARHVPLPAARVHVEPSWSAVAPLLASLAGHGDLILTLGAGDVTMIGPEVLDVLHRNAEGSR